MALKLKLRAREVVYVNGALLRNGGFPAEVEVLNRVPLLREKDIILEPKTACERLYFFIQGFYFDRTNEKESLEMLDRLAAEIAEAAPSARGHLARIRKHASSGDGYAALKAARTLIDYEKSLISHVTNAQ